MGKQKRTSVAAGASRLLSHNRDDAFSQTQVSRKPESKKSVSTDSQKSGKPELGRIMMDNVPLPVQERYDHLFLDLKRVHPKLKRYQYAPLVLEHGLNKKVISAALEGE